MGENREILQGRLRLVPGISNPAWVSPANLFLLQGDVSTPVDEIIPAPGVHFPSAGSHADGFHLTVAHFNDFHGRLSNISREDDEPVFSCLVSRLHRLQSMAENDENRGLLLLSAGDDLNGYIFSELFGRHPDEIKMHPSYHVYNKAGVHACGVGNHELDLGMAMLTEGVAREAQFPVLSANLLMAPQFTRSIHPAAIFVLKGVRIGIVGLTTRAECRNFDPPEYEMLDPLQVCRNLLPAIRPWCDVVILLSHLGLSLKSKTAVVEKYGDVELAEALEPEWVDLIVGGHTHNTLNCDGLAEENIVNRIPIVQAGAYGRWLGEVNLEKKDGFRVDGAHLVSLEDESADEPFEQQFIQPILKQLQPLRSQVLGRVADHPDVSPECVKDQFARGELALANMLADAMAERCRVNGFSVDCAMIDRTSLACGLQPGEVLTFEDWYSLMPHLDNIQVYHLRGGQLMQLVEDNAHRLDGWDEPDRERGFAHFSRSLRYQVLAGNSRQGAQAVHITFDDDILVNQQERLFSVATNCFFRGLCHAWEQENRPQHVLVFKEMDVPWECTRLFFRDEILSYLLEYGGATEAAGVRRDGRLQVIC